MNNPDLSFDSRLCSGDELLFTDDYVINEDILSYNRLNRITPANGERNVYMKEPVISPVCRNRYLQHGNIVLAFHIRSWRY